MRASRRTLLRPGPHDARITAAIEKPAKSGRDMIELTVVITDADGNEREFRDYLMDTPLGAAKLRHACEAVGVLEKYEAGEITQDDFPGHAVRVRVGIEKGKKGYPDRNLIEDYAAATRVVSLREAG